MPTFRSCLGRSELLLLCISPKRGDILIETLNFLISEFAESLFGLMDSLLLTSGVSLLGFLVAIILLTVIIGAILIRV